MLEIALTSFTTFFATIGPVEAAVLFATLTPKMTRRGACGDRRSRDDYRQPVAAYLHAARPAAARSSSASASPALQTAGGIILLLIALDMIFAKPTSAFKLTQPEDEEAQTKDDIAVFPLATPLLAGPGAMSAGILLAANTNDNPLALDRGRRRARRRDGRSRSACCCSRISSIASSASPRSAC